MADAYAAMDASPKRHKLPPKQLRHLEIRKGDGGGAVVEHVFTNYEHKPETHVFGKSEGKQLMAHLKEHIGIDADGDGEEY